MSEPEYLRGQTQDRVHSLFTRPVVTPPPEPEDETRMLLEDVPTWRRVAKGFLVGVAVCVAIVGFVGVVMLLAEAYTHWKF